MKFKELAQMSGDERRRKQKDLELELLKMNTQVATGTPPKNAGTISRIKKDIARIKLLDHLSKAQAAIKEPKGTTKAQAETKPGSSKQVSKEPTPREAEKPAEK